MVGDDLQWQAVFAVPVIKEEPGGDPGRVTNVATSAPGTAGSGKEVHDRVSAAMLEDPAM